MTSFWRTVQFGSWIVCCGLIAGCQSLDRQPSSVDPGVSTWLACPSNGSLDDKEVARSLGISTFALREVQQNRRRTNAELCSLKPDKLTREVGLARIARPLGASDQDFRLSRLRNGDGSFESMLGTKLRNSRASLELLQRPIAAATLPSDVAWSGIGPGNMGGRIRSIAVDATDSNRVFVGAVTGGIWYSPDAGKTWSCVTDSLGNMGIGWIVQDPNDAATFYATTGESTNSLAYDGHPSFGVGILVSRDRGFTWNIVSGTPSSAAARRLVAIPGMPGVVVTTNSEHGIYRSVDGGNNWTQVRPSEKIPWSNTVLPTLPYELVLDPADPRHLIAGDYLGGVTHSFDAGTTWGPRIALPVTTGPAYGNRVELAFAPSQPGLVYATVSPGHLGGGVNNSPFQTRLYRSADAGTSWTLVSHVVTPDSPGYQNGNGAYNNMLWVDPSDANHVVAGDVAAFRSTNGGQTWSVIVSGHVDHHAAVTDPGYNGTTNRRLWLVNDGGVYRNENIALATYNPGAPPGGSYGYSNLNSNLPITQFYAASGSAGTGGFVLGGSQDNGTRKVRSIAGDNAALLISGGDGFSNLIDPAGSGALFTTSQRGWIMRHVPDANYLIGYRQELLWREYPSEFSTFSTFVGLDPNHRDRLLMAGNSLWLSSNPWAPAPTRSPILAADPDPSNYLAAFAVAPTDSNTIWAMRVSKGQLHKTTNGLGAQPTWQAFTLPVGYARGINIYVDPGDANSVYALYGGTQGKNIWRTTDGGATWQDITGSLPGPAYVLTRHPTNASWLYVGAESGVYFSADAGASWYATADSPRNVPVEDLFWYDSNTLIAATYGRGLYRATTPGSTTIGLVSSRNPATAGAPVTFTATVAGVAPSASVAFTDGSATIAGCGAIAVTGAGNARTAACTTSALAPGAHMIVANYAGDSVNAASSSDPVYEIVTFVETGNTVQFATAAYNVNEFVGGLTVSVIRTGDVSAPASITYGTLPGSAAANADYASATGALSWGAGDALPKSFTVTIVDDVLIEPNETFDVVLSKPIGTVIGPRSTTSVTIFDDEDAVVGMPGTATVVSNPYGNLSVQGGTLNGNTITGLQKNAVIQLGSTAGSPSSFAAIDFQGVSIGQGNRLTVRSGASGQSIVLRNVDATASVITGVLQAQGSNGAPPPYLYLENPSGISVAAGGHVIAPSGLALDTLGNTATTGQSLVNQGVLDGGSGLRLQAAKINGGGAFKGNSAFVGTFGNANNPVNGSHFLANSLQFYPSSGNDVALTLNHYGPVPQVLNLMVNGNATVTMPSAWPVGASNPPNNPPVPSGGIRSPGTPEPSYGGGSMIVQATGTLKLQGGPSNDFAFPGGIVLKAGGDLNLNGVAVNQGWTTTGRAFQGVFFEAPNILSAGNIHVLSNNLNWINFSTLPHAPVRTWQLVQASDGTAQYVTADTIAPHLNTYSITVETAAAGQCYVCLLFTSPVNLY